MNRRNFAAFGAAALVFRPATAASPEMAVVTPAEYPGALRNPLKGLRAGEPASAAGLPYATLAKSYLKWNVLENHAEDGVERIRTACDAAWAGMAALGTKVVPRVYLDWPPDGHFWPADLARNSYDTALFRERAVRLINKLGACWDNDPRVAFVETGLIGLWGEQHDPAPSEELQAAIGDAYVKAFPDKLLMNRYPGHFTRYPFGIYWDSFGHKEELPTHLPLLESERMRDRWKTAPMGGETAFDWGTPLGKDPTDAVVHHADRIIELIRQLHWDHLGWLSNYDQHNELAVQNAARIQNALGYRFLLDEVRHPTVLRSGQPFSVEVAMRNTGSSPLYYRWPLQVNLLEVRTRKPLWSSSFTNLDLRTVLPGERRQVKGVFTLPGSLTGDSAILALSIPDPAGGRPAVRFNTTACFHGGWHPIGYVGVGRRLTTVPALAFDDPGTDAALPYS